MFFTCLMGWFLTNCVFGGLALMLNWLADHIELFPSWYIFPLSKDVVVRVKDDELEYWQDMEDK